MRADSLRKSLSRSLFYLITIEMWRRIIARVLRLPPGKSIRIPKGVVPRPETQGFIPTIGAKINARHWELPLPDGGRVHVEEYDDFYLVHRDKVSPLINPVEHLRRDAPWIWTLLTTGTGGLILSCIEYLLTDGKEWRRGAAIGALTGLLVGITTGEWGEA